MSARHRESLTEIVTGAGQDLAGVQPGQFATAQACRYSGQEHELSRSHARSVRAGSHRGMEVSSQRGATPLSPGQLASAGLCRPSSPPPESRIASGPERGARPCCTNVLPGALVGGLPVWCVCPLLDNQASWTISGLAHRHPAWWCARERQQLPLTHAAVAEMAHEECIVPRRTAATSAYTFRLLSALSLVRRMSISRSMKDHSLVALS